MMSRITRFGMLLPLVGISIGGTPTPLAAQSSGGASDSLPDPSKPAPTLAFQSGGAYLGNFFQAPDAEPKEDVFLGTGRLRVDFPLAGSALAVHGGLGGDLYDGFDPSLYLFIGSRWNPGIHRLEAAASFRTRSPRGEVGDSIGWADVLIASVSYGIRPVRAFEIQALAEMDRQVYSQKAERDNHAIRLGGAFRFFGLGYVLSPEVGAARGVRDVKANEEDYDERIWWITLRSVPAPPLYLSLRYRTRLRSYSLDQEGSGNFGREDDRRDLTLTAELDLSRRWSWTIYLSLQTAESTKVSRTFDTQYLWSGLSYTIG